MTVEEPPDARPRPIRGRAIAGGGSRVSRLSARAQWWLWDFDRGSHAYDLLWVLVILLLLLMPPSWWSDPMIAPG